MPRVADLSQVVSYADEHLRIREIDDWANALNGLQVENSGAVTKIGAAVDASTRTVADAIERGINLLVVHHGLFWPGLQPISGGRRACSNKFYGATSPCTAPIFHSTSIPSSGTTPSLPMRSAWKTRNHFSKRKDNASA